MARQLLVIRGVRSSLKMALVSLLTVGACSSAEKNIVGQWQTGQERLEFFDDGRVSINSGGSSLTGTWTILKDGRLKVEAEKFGTTVTMTGETDGTHMLLILDKDTARYTKVR